MSILILLSIHSVKYHLSEVLNYWQCSMRIENDKIMDFIIMLRLLLCYCESYCEIITIRTILK